MSTPLEEALEAVAALWAAPKKARERQPAAVQAALDAGASYRELGGAMGGTGKGNAHQYCDRHGLTKGRTS